MRKAVIRRIFPANIPVLPCPTYGFPKVFCGIIVPKANKPH